MTTLILTIDTEHVTQAPEPVLSYPNGAWGTVGGRHYGFPMIMDICERHGMKATFFVNVFEYKSVGEAVMARMCGEILGRGHDVQLHLHPAFVTGRALMRDHPLQTQIELVGQAKAKLESWTGRSTVAHRAGYYGANDDTIAALRANGILLDSSALAGHRSCGIGWARLSLTERDGCWELPISWFDVEARGGVPAGEVGVRRCKFDIDKAPLSDLADFTAAAQAAGYGHLTFAAHSFSFLSGTSDGVWSRGDDAKAADFGRLLGLIAESPSIEVRTVRELCGDIENGAARAGTDPQEILLAGRDQRPAPGRP